MATAKLGVESVHPQDALYPCMKRAIPNVYLGLGAFSYFRFMDTGGLSAQTFQNGFLIRFGLTDQSELHARALDSLAPEGA